ncbi:MAG TPA: bile acid:sodium symporter family protein [Acetobacteraceae bacterium]|jgi:sodium/bile acid cotransporter 7|nr:bile acid:sodium symporter family protein [Acetobacteraceae bacterium]
MRKLLSRLPIDTFIALLLATVAVAALLPARGVGAPLAGDAATLAIALLFFLYGVRLSPQAALAGARHGRLHLLVFLSTFALFPALGMAARALFPHLLAPELWAGVILLCVLPSTVQSSVAFTSIARGNVPAALCAATMSNLVGILLTPLLAGLLLSTGQSGGHGGISAHAIGDIVLQLLLPFAAGQALRPWIGGWVERNRRVLGVVDRGSILLVVYAAFSEGMVAGIWHSIDLAMLVRLFVVNAALLAAVLTITTQVSRRLGFSRADEITIVFCGSKKSLASGLPMASVLFASGSVGLIVLPLMLFHQLQLMACAALARRYAAAQTTALPVGDSVPASG